MGTKRIKNGYKLKLKENWYKLKKRLQIKNGYKLKIKILIKKLAININIPNVTFLTLNEYI